MDPEVVRRMAGAIRHRGPDDEGFYCAGPVGFGFRRLSIIDLAGGHQPMSDAEGSVWVVFNGEIYNYRELRRELEAAGHCFRTRSDTEVIVHGYKQWGVEVLQRFNGMFGLAIWDVEQRRLVVARDAMGIKPVYYHLGDGCLTFGSEIRAVLAGLSQVPDVDAEAAAMFLQFRYVPAPWTMFQGIRKLAPGTCLICERGQCREQRWYNYRPAPFHQMEAGEAREELLRLYRAAMQRHLLSDVPVGLLLSGGVDSGLLLGLMNESGGNWPAYTVGYGEVFEDDELADAAESARLLGARHIPVKLDREEFERDLPVIASFLEEPVASSSVVPMYYVCRRARQDVKVALIGQGPDELFAGYTRHLGVFYGEHWRRLPSPVRAALRKGVAKLPRAEALKRGVSSLGQKERLERYAQVFALAPQEQIRALFSRGVLGQDGLDSGGRLWGELLPQMEELDELGGFQLVEVRSSLPDELLMYGDKLSMAHGLEARVPYLDREVVEFAQRLPSSLKVRWGRRKWLHREVCRSYLDSRILRRKKRGFAVNVVDGWFQSSVQGAFAELLLDGGSQMYDFLKPAAVRDLLLAHRSGREDHHKVLFSLVMLEQWLRVCPSAAGPAVPVAA